MLYKNKKDGKDQESIQSSTTPEDTNGKVTTSHLDITNESQENKPMERDHYWLKGHNFNKLGRGPIGDALHQI